MTRNSILDFVSERLPDQPDAVRMLNDLFRAMHTWDDLVDKDKPVSEADINGAFVALMVHIPANPYYQRHFAQLHPLISAATIDWLAANDMERTGAVLDREIAFVTRSNYAMLVLKVIEVCRGYGFAAVAAADVRRTIHQEGLAAYCADLDKQKGN